MSDTSKFWHKTQQMATTMLETESQKLDLMDERQRVQKALHEAKKTGSTPMPSPPPRVIIPIDGEVDPPRGTYPGTSPYAGRPGTTGGPPIPQLRPMPDEEMERLHSEEEEEFNNRSFIPTGPQLGPSTDERAFSSRESFEQAQFNRALTKMRNIGQNILGVKKFDPTSQDFLDALSESFPNIISKRIIEIMGRGPQSQEEADELRAAFRWGEMESTGVTPELRAAEAMKADIRTQNLARVENNKLIDTFQESFLYKNFTNKDGTMNRGVVEETSIEMIHSFLSVLGETDIEEAFGPLLNEETIGITKDPIDAIGMQFASEVEEEIQKAMELNKQRTQQVPIDYGQIYKRVFQKKYGDQFDGRLQTPFDDTAIPYTPNGFELLEPQTQQSIADQTRSELTEVEDPDLDPMPMFRGEGVKARNEQRAVVDSLHSRYIDLHDAEKQGTSEDIMRGHLNVARGTIGILNKTIHDMMPLTPEEKDRRWKEWVDDSLEPAPKPVREEGQSISEYTQNVKHWEQSEAEKEKYRDNPLRYKDQLEYEAFEDNLYGDLGLSSDALASSDYQYVASLLNEMGLTSIDTSRPFSERDVPIYLAAFEEAESILVQDINKWTNTYERLTDPRKIYDNIMMERMGDLVGHEFKNITEVNMLIYDVLNNPDNYDDASATAILSKWNYFQEATTKALDYQQTTADYLIMQRDIENSLRNPGQATAEGKNPTVFFNAPNKFRESLQEGDTTALQIEDTLLRHYGERWTNTFNGIMSEVDPDFDPTQSPTFAQVMGYGEGGWRMGDQIPWENMDQTSKTVMARMLVEGTVDNPLPGGVLSVPLKAIQTSLTNAYSKLAQGGDIAQMSVVDQAEIISAMNLTSHLIRSAEMTGQTNTRRTTRQLLAGGDEEKYLSLVAMHKIFVGGMVDTGVELIDYAELMGDKPPEEIANILAQRMQVDFEAIDAFYDYTSNLFLGTPLPDFSYGRESIFSLNREEKMGADFTAMLSKAGLSFPTDLQGLKDLYEELRPYHMIDYEAGETNWFFDADEDQLTDAIRETLYYATADPETRRLLETVTTAYVSSQKDGSLLDIGNLFKLGNLHVATEKRVAIGSYSISNGPFGAQELRDMRDLIQDEEIEAPWGHDDPAMWENLDDRGKMGVHITKWNGPRDAWGGNDPNYIAHMNTVYMERNADSPEYSGLTLAQSKEKAQQEWQGVAYATPNTMTTGVINRWEAEFKSKEVYQATCTGWIKDNPAIRDMLVQNFGIEGSGQVMHTQYGMTPEEYTAAMNDVVDSVITDYSSTDVWDQLRAAGRRHQQQRGFFTDNWSWEKVQYTYAPNLVDLHCECLARFDETYSGRNKDESRANAVNLGGTNKIPGIRKYPNVSLEHLRGSLSRPGGVGGDTYDNTVRLKVRDGNPILFRWGFNNKIFDDVHGMRKAEEQLREKAKQEQQRKRSWQMNPSQNFMREKARTGGGI